MHKFNAYAVANDLVMPLYWSINYLTCKSYFCNKFTLELYFKAQ